LLNNDETNALLANYAIRENNVSFSPFNQFFILKSMAKLGLYNEAFTSINDSWGGQLQFGATTFWECFRSQWTQVVAPLSPVPNGQCGYTSLCHPWSSGITKWLSEEVLGIKPIVPGFEKFVVKPHLTNELTWVRGSVMTVNGQIKSEFDRQKGTASLIVPQGTLGSFALPKQNGTIGEVKVNGTTVWKGGSIQANHAATLRNQIDYLYLEDLKPGTYSISFSSTSAIEKSKPVATANLVKASTTSSELSGIKNAKGYILFNQLGKGKHERNLPAFIDSVGWKQSGPGSPGNVIWTVPAIAEKGAFRTSNPNACMQTFYVDVFSKADQIYSFSLITKSGDTKDRSFIAEIFDLETKNLVSNPVLIKNTNGTTTYTYSSRRPVRVRISHIEGENSVLSGIIFN
jgi:alpha-L-rhamnosidase